MKIDRTTPALVRFKPTGSDYSAVEKDFIVAYYLPGPMQVCLLMRERLFGNRARQHFYSCHCVHIKLLKLEQIKCKQPADVWDLASG